MKRSAGILLPIFSLPSEYGIGSLGAEARAFANFLQDAGQSWWQILPVGPAGAGDSPYASESTFAGNPLFIDLDLLARDGLLTEEELGSAKVPAGNKIDYAALKKSREPLLRKAFSRVSGEAAEAARAFAEERPWVREYALYYILGVQHGACKNMKPQQILIDFFQAWKHRLECMYHTDERSEITRVPGFMIFREKGAVSKPMIEYRLIRMRHPKAEIWQPQAFHRSDRIGGHGHRVEL